jgi:Na+-translocating ferredoxin:NAD+ oxidoreductase RnfD subunit
MVTDPPTSPPRHRDQIVFGVITGVVAFAVFIWVGAAYYLLAGLLVANLWEARRRVVERARRAWPKPPEGR